MSLTAPVKGDGDLQVITVPRTDWANDGWLAPVLPSFDAASLMPAMTSQSASFMAPRAKSRWMAPEPMPPAWIYTSLPVVVDPATVVPSLDQLAASYRSLRRLGRPDGDLFVAPSPPAAPVFDPALWPGIEGPLGRLAARRTTWEQGDDATVYTPTYEEVLPATEQLRASYRSLRRQGRPEGEPFYPLQPPAAPVFDPALWPAILGVLGTRSGRRADLALAWLETLTWLPQEPAPAPQPTGDYPLPVFRARGMR
jgi:hypothetical protein